MRRAPRFMRRNSARKTPRPGVVGMRGAGRPEGGPMQSERIATVDNPGVVMRGFYAVGRRLFGEVPTPQKLMAHRPALMLGMGALWTSIECFGSLDGRLRALLQLNVARLYDATY